MIAGSFLVKLLVQDDIVWECQNSGQLYSSNVTIILTTLDTLTSFPADFCAVGFSSLYAAFIIGLLALDLIFQVSHLYLSTSLSPLLI